jgi:hypothetical protein
MYHRTSTTTFRQRGYHCPICKVSTFIFGNDNAPVACSTKDCVGQLVKDWDHMVTQDTEVRDFATGNVVK